MPVRSNYTDVASCQLPGLFPASLGFSRIPHSQLLRAARVNARLRNEMEQPNPDYKFCEWLSAIDLGLSCYPGFIPMGLVDSNL